jgi:hypothetical protein
MINRIERLNDLRVHVRMDDFPDDLLRRHARRLAGRAPSAGALIQERARSIETACFLRYCLLLATDRLLMMVRRQVFKWGTLGIGVGYLSLLEVDIIQIDGDQRAFGGNRAGVCRLSVREGYVAPPTNGI